MTDLATVARRTGAMLMQDNKTHQHRMQIRSESSDRLYTVAQRIANETWECSCPGWIRHRNCKHLNVMVPLLRGAA